jgi:hypothetical protein
MQQWSTLLTACLIVFRHCCRFGQALVSKGTTDMCIGLSEPNKARQGRQGELQALPVQCRSAGKTVQLASDKSFH